MPEQAVLACSLPSMLGGNPTCWEDICGPGKFGKVQAQGSYGLSKANGHWPEDGLCMGEQQQEGSITSAMTALLLCPATLEMPDMRLRVNCLCNQSANGHQ